MKNTESKCHAFWKTNRNPITMQKDETPEMYQINTASRKRRVSEAAFNYDELEDCSDGYDDGGFMGEDLNEY